MFWLKEGDENRKFFHANASARRKANRVSLLMTDDGSRVDDKMGMSELVLNFFKTVFAAPGEETTRHQLSSPRVITQD